jgi:acyl carrier protein
VTGFDYKEAVLELIIEELGIAGTEILPESRFVDDLSADSLDMVELVMSVEEMLRVEFGKEFSIPDEDAEKIVTVQDAYDIVGKLLEKEEAA